MTGFDSADAGTGSFQGIGACNIDGTETISGSYIDGHNVHHGSLRVPDDTITSFDLSGAVKGPDRGTVTSGEGPLLTVW
jgi:hypothetical protein